ncbi:hypothetical protein PG994_001043 [Apiospora phragmitis]|uniref:Uncharacterized protein n=1 Tax=Apiospora phragmitis TaxID=2905665 RepID=A0ABR1WSE6_9PEZI
MDRFYALPPVSEKDFIAGLVPTTFLIYQAGAHPAQDNPHDAARRLRAPVVPALLLVAAAALA